MERYLLQKSNTQDGWWILTDTLNGLVCKFKEHEYNTTQSFTMLDDAAFIGKSPVEIARIARELGDWGAENHYEKLMPAPSFPASERLRIGRQLAALRNEQRLTIRELSEKSCIHYSNISQIEQGRYNASLDVIAKIARALGAKLEIKNN